MSPGGGIVSAAAEAWVRERVPIAGPLEHVQTEPWASVYRASVGGDVVWFKACSPRQVFEVPLTASLSSLWPVATEVLAHDAARRWLLMADAGVNLASLGNPPERWLEVLPAYAELQIGETTHVHEHLAAGVPDLRLVQLPALFEEMVRAELPLEDGERRALVGLQPHVAEMCEELDAAGIGPSVQHDDLHVYNVYVKDGSLRVLDWGDSSIAHPFFSLFETFRFLGEFNGLAPGDPWFARLRDAYLEPWGPGQREAFDLAARVAGLAHAVSWLHQREALPPSERRTFDDGFDHILRLALDGVIA